MEYKTGPVWSAVGELERNRYTREEIADTLRAVADALDAPDGTQ